MLTFVFQHQMVLWNMSRGHKIVLKHSRGWWWQYIKDGKEHIVAVQQWFGSMEHFRGPEHQQLMPWCDSNHAVTTGCSTILTHIHTYTYTITHTHSLHIHLHTHVIVHTQTILIMQSPFAILKYTLPNITQDGLPRQNTYVMYSPGEFPIMQVLLGEA